MNKGMGAQPGMAPTSSMGMMPPNPMPPMGKYCLYICVQNSENSNCKYCYTNLLIKQDYILKERDFLCDTENGLFEMFVLYYM